MSACGTTRALALTCRGCVVDLDRREPDRHRQDHAGHKPTEQRVHNAVYRPTRGIDESGRRHASTAPGVMGVRKRAWPDVIAAVGRLLAVSQHHTATRRPAAISAGVGSFAIIQAGLSARGTARRTGRTSSFPRTVRRQLGKPVRQLGVRPEPDEQLLDPVPAMAVALAALDVQHVELADQVAWGHGAVAGHGLSIGPSAFRKPAIGACRGRDSEVAK